MGFYMGILNEFVKLEEIDYEIFQVLETQKRLPKKLTKKKKEVDKEKSIKDKYEEDIKRGRIDVMDKESVLATKDSNIEKKLVQLNQVKTNKEYTALQKEIEDIKKEREKLEEEVIKLMETNEQKLESCDKQKEKIKEQEQAFEEYQKEVEQDMKKVQKELDALKKKRKIQRDIIVAKDDKTLQQYERVLASGTGKAMVPVEEEACGFCHIQLLRNEISLLLAGKITFCKECGRLLYLPEKLYN